MLKLQKTKRALAGIASLVGVAFGGLAVILLVNTVLFTSKQIAPGKIPPVKSIKLDENEAVKRLSGSLKFKTVSDPDPSKMPGPSRMRDPSKMPDPSKINGNEFLEMHEYLERSFPKVHKELKRQIVGKYSLLFHWQGSHKSLDPILLMSHLDVVRVEPGTEDDWTHPPFSGEIADGYIWGRGALDIKCGVMGILEAVELLLKKGFQPERTVFIALGHDEEVGGSNGNAKIAAMLDTRGIRLQYVLDEGGVVTEGIIPGISEPVAFIGVAEKGYVNVVLSIDEQSAPHLGGHSSMPPPQTAVGVLAAAITRLESHPFPTRLSEGTDLMLDYVGPEMPFLKKMVIANRWLFRWLIPREFAKERATNATVRTTTAVTMIEGGVMRNVLPTKAWAAVNFRILTGDSVADVESHVRQITSDERITIKVDSHAVASEPSGVSDTESAEFKTLQRTIRQVFPNAVVAPGLAVVTTDSAHYRTIAKNTFRFIPTRITEADIERVHGTNERISEKNYIEIIRFFVRQIHNSTCSDGDCGHLTSTEVPSD